LAKLFVYGGGEEQVRPAERRNDHIRHGPVVIDHAFEVGHENDVFDEHVGKL
jgi:hypothetical protein